MGYSNSLRAIKRVEPILDSLLDMKTELSWEHDDPNKLAYYLREALAVARKTNHEKYGHLHRTVTFKVVGGKVTALRIDSQVVKARMAESYATSLKELIGFLIQQKPAEVSFPAAQLTKLELNKLYLWCKDAGYHIILGDGIVITTSDDNNLAWHP